MSNQIMKSLLSYINYLGTKIPKRMQRGIVEFPGVLWLIEKLSGNAVQEVTTPEGYRLSLNPVFHANLIKMDNLLGYEPQIRQAITQLAKPGMVAYDIGANVGVFTYLFRAIVGDQGKVYAFEPERNNYNCLALSLKANQFDNIVLDTRAVGNAQGKGNFDRRGGAFSGRLVGQTPNYHVTDNIEMVETVSIDHLVLEEAYQAPDILKIDVEGNEILVLEGMSATLARHSPIIICELHGHLGDGKEKVVQLLLENGYLIYDIGLQPLTNILEGGLLEGINHIVAMK